MYYCTMETYLSQQQGMWLMPIITRILHAKYDLSNAQDIEVIKVSLWLPWQSSYHSNEVGGCAYCPKEVLCQI